MWQIQFDLNDGHRQLFLKISWIWSPTWTQYWTTGRCLVLSNLCRSFMVFTTASFSSVSFSFKSVGIEENYWKVTFLPCLAHLKKNSTSYSAWSFGSVDYNSFENYVRKVTWVPIGLTVLCEWLLTCGKVKGYVGSYRSNCPVWVTTPRGRGSG